MVNIRDVRSSPKVSAKRLRAGRIRQGAASLSPAPAEPQIRLAGDVYELRPRCGKPSCACARSDEKRHRRWVLSYTVEGEKRMRVVPLEHLAEWRVGQPTPASSGDGAPRWPR